MMNVADHAPASVFFAGAAASKNNLICGYGGIGSFENERTPYGWRSEFEKAQKQGELRRKEQGDYVSSGLAGAAAI